MSERPDLAEALEGIAWRVEYAIRLAAEARMTPDGEDESGEVDPIHAYSESVIRNTVPLAILGLFALQSPSLRSIASLRSEKGNG